MSAIRPPKRNPHNTKFRPGSLTANGVGLCVFVCMGADTMDKRHST